MEVKFLKKLKVHCQTLIDSMFSSPFLVGCGVGLVLGFILGIIVSFILGIIVTYISGVATGLLANYLWDKYRKIKRGKEPYIDLSVHQEGTYGEFLLPNTADNATAIKKMFDAATTPKENRDFPDKLDN